MEEITLPSVGAMLKNGSAMYLSSQNVRPIPKLLRNTKIKIKIKINIFWKKGVAVKKATCSLLDCRLRSPALLAQVPVIPPLQNSPSSSCPHLWAHVVNSCWLAPALARPA
jgi:hypothetical protein